MRYEPDDVSLEELRKFLEENDELSGVLESIAPFVEEQDRTPGKITLPFVSEEPVHETSWVK